MGIRQSEGGGEEGVQLVRGCETKCARKGGEGLRRQGGDGRERRG
jgi:hypothetical protein